MRPPPSASQSFLLVSCGLNPWRESGGGRTRNEEERRLINFYQKGKCTYRVRQGVYYRMKGRSNFCPFFFTTFRPQIAQLAVGENTLQMCQEVSHFLFYLMSESCAITLPPPDRLSRFLFSTRNGVSLSLDESSKFFWGRICV